MEAAAQDYRLLDTHLARQSYLAGDHFTLADIPAGTTLYRYFGLGLERPDMPHVEVGVVGSDFTARAAYREHVMIPFTELRGRLEY